MILNFTASRLFAVLLCLGVVSGSELLSTSTARGEEKKEEPKKITYDDHILPIFRQRCGSCHNANDQKGGLVLDTFTGTMAGGGSGEVVAAGDASGSYLYMVVAHESEPVMPPNQPKMPEEELALIRQWIELGALENQGSKVVKKKNDLSKIEISSARPADAPVLPIGVTRQPTVVTNSANSITALACSPWASLAAVSGHEQVLLFDTETGVLSAVFPFPEGVAQILKFSRNGQLLMAGGGRGGASGKVVVWDVKTGNRVAELGNEYDAVLAADISADHTQVVLSGPKRMIRVYSVQSGELMYELKKHTDWVLSAEFSPDGVLIATADRSNGMFLWEAITGNEYLSIKGHTGAITDVSWRPDSNLVASCSEDGTIRLWELNDGREVKRWNAHGGGVSAIEFTRDARIVSIGRDKTVKLWDSEGKELKAFSGLTDLGLNVAFDSEKNRALGGDWTGEVRVWDAVSGSHLYSIHSNPPALSEQLVQLNQRLQQQQQQQAGLTTQKQGVEQQIAARKQAVDNAKSQFAKLETDIAKMQSDKQASEKVLNDSNTRAAQLKATVDSLQKQITTAQAAVQSATKTLQDQQKTLASQQSELSAKEKLVAELTAKIAQLEQQGEPATEELTATRQTLEQTQKQQSDLKTLVEQSTTVVATSQSAVQAQQAAVVELTKQSTAASQEAAQVATAIQAATSQIKQQGEGLANLAKQREAQQKAVADLESKIAPTDAEKAKLAELTAQISQTEQTMVALQAHATEVQKQLSSSAQAANN